MMPKKTLLQLRHIKKHFSQGDEVIEVLRDIDLKLEQGTITSLMGPSGSGKSTLLHIVGLLEEATEGTILLENKDITDADDHHRTSLRRRFFGFVYQYHHLLSELTALENVMLPALLNGMNQLQARERALSLLTQLQCDHRRDHRPATLSGGEQQRVALARGLSHKPALLIADEPTGNLDTETAREVFELFLRHAREESMTLLLATHNPILAQKTDTIYHLKDGQLTNG